MHNYCIIWICNGKFDQWVDYKAKNGLKGERPKMFKDKLNIGVEEPPFNAAKKTSKPCLIIWICKVNVKTIWKNCDAHSQISSRKQLWANFVLSSMQTEAICPTFWQQKRCLLQHIVVIIFPPFWKKPKCKSWLGITVKNKTISVLISTLDALDS